MKCPNCSRKDDEIRRLHTQLESQDHQAKNRLESLRQEKESLEGQCRELASQLKFYKDPRHEIRDLSESAMLSPSFPYPNRESGNSNTLLITKVSS